MDLGIPPLINKKEIRAGLAVLDEILPEASARGRRSHPVPDVRGALGTAVMTRPLMWPSRMHLTRVSALPLELVVGQGPVV